MTGEVAGAALIVDVDGFEGPLDLLLALARAQKVDLRAISVLELAHQYLAAVERARAPRVELAADWLVMAAWLAYLKSALLLPDAAEEAPSAEAEAARLALRLARLDAMRGAAAALLARDRRGRDVFARGAPEVAARGPRPAPAATLVDLARAYGRLRTRDAIRPLAFERDGIWTMEEALAHLRAALAGARTWSPLGDLIPSEWSREAPRRRSATASAFAAALELARIGAVDLRQDAPGGPVRLRAAP